VTDLARAGRLGLGLAALGRPAYITGGRDRDLGGTRSVEHLRARSHAVLDAAAEVGLRYLDAARSYGLAEQFLADWLTGRADAGDLVVASKWGYTYVGDWDPDAEVHEVKDHSLAAFERQAPQSLDLLSDHLDLYSIHSVTPESPALTDPDLLARLADWSRGHGVAVGISTSGPAQADVVRAALEVEVEGRQLFSAVQSTWNLLEPSAGPALAEAADAGWLVVVKEGVANGRLAGAEVPAALARAAGVIGTTPDALALAVVLAQPWRPVVLSGAVTPDQLRSNVAAVEVEDDEALATQQALSALVETPPAYWRRRSDRPWA
jgi:aryl-alcohol dehydrogenase-like predicted oxidoreductase